ncbi:MAG: two-component system sensor histidine kinase NtrB [Desulfosalsimonas sp.]
MTVSIARRTKAEQDLYQKLRWVLFFRALFALVMLGSAFAAAARPAMNLGLTAGSLDWLILLAAGLLVLSAGYRLVLPRIHSLGLFAYLQIAADTVAVSVIIWMTGGFSSIFAFMYLVVIVYAAMVIYRRGGMVTATLCAIQYGILVDLEYYGLLPPLGDDAQFLIDNYDWPYVIYKLVFTIAACYAVAFLSGLLSEQEKAAKQDLWAMEEQMKRVERLAAVGEMAAGLAHEIKNPLASLSGSIQLLRDQLPYDPGQERLIEIALREADRLSTLVTDFLMFSRPGPGKAETIELNRAVPEIVSLFQSDPGHRSRIDVRTDVSGNLFVRIDPEHFKQVMWNLLNNAAEAITDRGVIEIRVYPFRKTHAGIDISDTGSGIAPEMLARIFDPFVSTKSRGTGLGLSIVQQLINAYGGLVHIDSAPDAGTTVTLRLPAHRPAG